MEFIPPKRAKLNLFEKIITILLMFFFKPKLFWICFAFAANIGITEVGRCPEQPIYFFFTFVEFWKDEGVSSGKLIRPEVEVEILKGHRIFQEHNCQP